MEAKFWASVRQVLAIACILSSYAAKWHSQLSQIELAHSATAFSTVAVTLLVWKVWSKS
jgi:hypothetical protein